VNASSHFPRWFEGTNRRFSQRYQLQRFGKGFMRLALESSAPIVPIANLLEHGLLE
jgi:hypothetical protein